jgi:hypothetical protein
VLERSSRPDLKEAIASPEVLESVLRSDPKEIIERFISPEALERFSRSDPNVPKVEVTLEAKLGSLLSAVANS